MSHAVCLATSAWLPEGVRQGGQHCVGIFAKSSCAVPCAYVP